MNGNRNFICCPVCTLYLREGISLKSHLNTHPKDQVIEALIRCSFISSAPAKQQENTDYELQHVIVRSDGDVSGVESTPPVPYNPAGGSHFTASITYQHFLSSNTPPPPNLPPQFVSVPTVLASPVEDGNNDTSQAAVMPFIYNPYVVPQHQQEFEVLNPIAQLPPEQPHMRQVTESNQSAYSEQSPIGALNSLLNRSTQHSPNVQTDQATQTNKDSLVSQPSSPNEKSSQTELLSDNETKKEVTNDAISDLQQTNCNSENETQNSPKSGTVDTNAEHTSADCSPVHQILGGEDDCLIVTETHRTIKPARLLHSSDIVDNSEKQTLEYVTSNEPVLTFDDHFKASFPETEKRQVKESDENVQECSHDTRSTAFLTENNLTHPSDSYSDNCEINTINGKSSSMEVYRSTAKANINLSENIADNSEITLKSNISLSSKDCSETTPREIQQNDSEFTYANVCPVSLTDTEPDNETMKQSFQDKSTSMDIECPETSEAVDPLELDNVSIQEDTTIDVIEPQVFFHSQDIPDAGVIKEITVETSHKELKQDDSSAQTVDLNIQADELMPPRGELSEQESLGGNDSSMWTQSYNDGDVSTSYDLLARESWGASDGSDTETSRPLNDLPVAKSSVRESVSKKGKMKKVYKCLSCTEIFNCPKERRVHRRRFHTDATEVRKDKQFGDVFSAPTVKEELVETVKVENKNVDLCVPPAESLSTARTPDSNGPSSSSAVKIKTEKTDTPVLDVDHDQKKIKTSDSLVAKLKPEPAVGETQTGNGPEDTVKQEYKCISVNCALVFTSQDDLKEHVHTAHKLRKKRGCHICPTCQEAFSTDVLYRAHLKIHPLECKYCGKFFTRHQNLNLHTNRHLGIKPFKCGVCDKSFITKQKLTEHTNVHTGEAPIRCDLCCETFRRYSNLIQHKNRHHLNLKKKVKDFICQCGEVFHTKKKLEWHKETHDAKPKSCGFCSVRFVHAVSLTRHIRKAHDSRYVPQKEREGENVECPVCSAVCLKNSLSAHMRLHSGERPHQCPLCSKSFTTKWNLRLHRWTHTARSAKPYKCEICRAAFHRESCYSAHVRSHRGTRPYTCNYCGRCFVYKYNCVRHVREHELGKNYVCGVCGKLFHRGYYLKEHMTVHTGIRPYTCHICGKASPTKSNHNKHLKIHHAREPVNTEG
ncbi:zinc finger protein 711 [Schistocerca piceifrons]|uniref:zinc finger protein 711 n=1 Tax=Schistocerca piceifrons TaxID=274613 RepID=UPI001F5ED1FB|nr:zinc finger protein 711 [Schistocerca piceifrons]